MLLRRITAHVKAQNWFAVGIDFIIVVVGVFIGIQVANWNDARAFDKKEAQLLVELKRELEATMRITSQKRVAHEQVVKSGKKALDFIARGQSCGNECWSVLVDFYHASQWQAVDVSRSTYDEMRRLSLPKSREIVDAMEGYLAQNVNIASVVNDKPLYRSHVRSLIPTAVHDAYWATCYDLVDGEDFYVDDCPEGVSNAIAADAVNAITGDPDTVRHLTFWYSEIVITPEHLADQNAAAGRVIAAIDAELGKK